MQRYLTPADYTIQIRSEIKTLIGGADELKLVIAETAAVQQMKSWLKKRYDVDNIFFLNQGAFDPGVDYLQGQLVYYKAVNDPDEKYVLYQAIANTPQAVWDASKWTVFANRNPFVTLYCIDLTLYHLHSKDATRLIPQVRSDRYQDALDWLKAVANGEIDADLPQLPDTDANYKPDIRFNSHPLENQRW